MKPFTLRLEAAVVFVVVLLGGIASSATHPVSSAKSSQPSPCATPDYRQFDFWLGDWDAFDADNPTTVVARNRVDLILDGCVVREDYEGTDGHRGQSFSIYDASRQVWHQTWVTNRGELLMIEEKMQAGEMTLSGTDHGTSGQLRQVRGAWKAMDGGVRETAATSTDAGKTWKPWFDLMLRPHSAANLSAGGDETIVADRDTQYQAAVKRNDAATMDRILADDFVLVTGSGKVYNKADLLNEARSGRVVYEHQEDTDQIVRVWGDTAVVTAKLWEKGTDKGKPFDHTVWFSDTYVRTPAGWRYVFGQASLPLPKTP